MPWVRIDENAMEHPKIAGLPDGAFRLWVVGLSYCQKYLTDGFISEVSVKGLRGYSPKRKAELVSANLWRDSETGIVVHDFLDWNESREHVQMARRMARERLKKHREKRVSNAVTHADRNAHAPVGGCNGDTQALKEPRSEGGLGETAKHGGKLAYDGRFLTVFRWQYTELGKRLAEQQRTGFDLLRWFERVETQIDRDCERLPVEQNARWKWLLDRLYLDAELEAPRLAGKKGKSEDDDGWFEECQRLHAGACGGSRRHRTQRLLDESRKAASA